MFARSAKLTALRSFLLFYGYRHCNGYLFFLITKKYCVVKTGSKQFDVAFYERGVCPAVGFYRLIMIDGRPAPANPNQPRGDCIAPVS